MTAVQKQDSNVTGLRFTAEASFGVLPASPIWTALEPNSYSDLGPQYKQVSRMPINSSRQQSKGSVTDMDVTTKYQADVTFDAFAQLAQGFMFASYRTKTELVCATVNASGWEPAAGGAAFDQNDLVFAAGFANAANNGLHAVNGAPTGTEVPFAGSVAETGATAGYLVQVGHECPVGDITVDVSGPFPVFRSTALDFTTFGVIPGEWIFVGGDTTGSEFAIATNNGYARVNSVTTNALTVDKTQNVMAADTGTGKAIQFFFGRVCKNESDRTLQVKRTFQVERTLGAPDDASTNEQAEYLLGCGCDQLALTFNTADKITAEISFIGGNYQTNSATEGLAPGTRPDIAYHNVFNSTSHVKRASIAICGQQAGLFAYATVGGLTIKNNIKANKAIGILGAFDFSAGEFSVEATLTSYFADVAVLVAFQDNANVTMDYILALGNVGIAMDMPLGSIGGGRLNVAANEPILAPITYMAARGRDYNPNMDHTLLLVFFPYLPNLAM